MQTISEILVSQGILSSKIEQFYIIQVSLYCNWKRREGDGTFVDVDNLST